MSQAPERVLVVEENPILRQALCAAVDQCGDLEVVASATSGEEALARLEEVPADVVLVGSVAKQSGPHLVDQVLARHPSTAHLLIAGFEDGPASRAAQNGLRGVVPKDAPVEELCGAINAVVAERPRLSRLTQRRAGVISREDSFGRLLESLTPQEVRVLDLLARGLSDKEIAATLHLASDTVRHHVSHLLKKLRKRSRTQVVVEMLRRRRGE